VADLAWRHLAVWGRDGPGPAFFPGFLAVALVALGILLAFDLDRDTRRINPADMVGEEGASFVNTAKFCVLLVGLIVAFPYLGGVLALSTFVLFEMLWVERARLRDALLTAAAAFCAIWLLFVHILAVPLPAGPLGLMR
jgi:hypothetical protein